MSIPPVTFLEQLSFEFIATFVALSTRECAVQKDEDDVIINETQMRDVKIRDSFFQ